MRKSLFLLPPLLVLTACGGGGGVVNTEGSTSMADLMAVLYGGVLNVDPREPRKEDRDWVVVSKGHSGPSLYAALALRGYFPVEELASINKPGTRLPSHCDRNRTPGVDISTGSLGQGMSSAIGVALGNADDFVQSQADYVTDTVDEDGILTALKHFGLL